MRSQQNSFLPVIGALGLAALALSVLAKPALTGYGSFAPPAATSTTQTASVSSASSNAASSSPSSGTKTTPAAPPVKDVPENKPESSATSSETAVERIEDPYPFPQRSFTEVNVETRAALVNILCVSQGGGMNPISASGVIIDPRGVVLTNAHVAQYVLLAQSGRTNLSCAMRQGSPARPTRDLQLLYIPPAWVAEHARDITAYHPTGTGERDYALLLAGADLAASPGAENPLPYLPFDVRERIGFLDDVVLSASYPAEFVGGLAAQFNLYAASSLTKIRDLLTFKEGTVDLISVGGVIQAQSGSSGGAIVNAWGRLIGIIVTTSAGATTAERDLRAITLSYIDRDIAAESGRDIAAILSGDVRAQAAEFELKRAPALAQLLIEQVSPASR